MRTIVKRGRHWPYWATLAAAAGVLAAVAAGSGLAAAKTKPSNQTPPRIVGVARVGQILTGERGNWSQNPTKYEYAWLRCASNGGSCDAINGATGTQYQLTADDDGHTVRFRVTASNSDGSSTAQSAQTSVVTAAGKPANTALPTITGTPQENSTLTGTNGTWTNNPSKYEYAWQRCDKSGGACSSISGATKNTYTLTSADVGATIRFRVVASNSLGSDTALSGATSVVSKFRGQGCPATGNPDQVTAINPPARLLIDSVQSEPAVVGRSTQTVTIKFHVTSTCGGPVQGALVYATAVPYNQFAIPPEQPSGADGWATLTFQRLKGFPASKHQRQLTVFVRARKSTENVLTGISNRRLMSVRVNLNH